MKKGSYYDFSYTDGMLCDTWNRYNSISEEFLIKVFMNKLKNCIL